MWPFNDYPVSPGYETGDHPTSPTSVSRRQGGHASPSERPTAVGGQEANLYDWITLPYSAPSQVSVDTVGGIAETLISAITVQSPIPSSHPPPQDWDMRTSHHCSAGVHPPSSQHAIQTAPVLRHDVVTLEDVNSDIFGRSLPSRASPHSYHDQAEETQGFSGYGAVFPTYQAATGPLSSGGDSQTSQVVAIREAPPSDTTSLVSGLPLEMGSEETARPPVGLSQSGTNNESKNPKKRKSKVTTQDKPRKVKRTKYSMVRLLNLPRGRIQPTPRFLSGRPDLRPMRQIEYKSWNSQGKWTKLPDIDFRVEGKDGINLIDAKNDHFNGLDGRYDLMFTDGNVGGSISCRTIFEGYRASENARQIVTTDHRRERSRITRKRLAQDTAKRIEAYLEELKAAGTPYPVRLEDMFLTKLTHVARASWQPQIWCRVASSSSTST